MPGSGYETFARQYAGILARHGVVLDIRNFAGPMEDLELLRNPACEVQAALTTFGVTQPADADALYSLGGRKSFPPRSYLPFSRITFSIRRSGISHITATIT